MRGLPEGWRIVDMAPDKIDAHLKTVARNVKELEAIPRIKIPPTKEQSPETQRLLDNQAKRPVWQDEAYIKERWIQEMPDGAQLPGDYSTVAGIKAAVGTRDVSPEEIASYPYNQGPLIDAGTPGTSPERREKAKEAFLYSKPAEPSDEDLKRLGKLTGLDAVAVTQLPDAPEEPKRPWRNLWGWIQGHAGLEIFKDIEK